MGDCRVLGITHDDIPGVEVALVGRLINGVQRQAYAYADVYE